MSSRSDIAAIGHYTWTLLFIGIIISLYNIIMIVFRVVTHQVDELVWFQAVILVIGMGPYFLIISRNHQY